MLARAASKLEYGSFALLYSVFTFLSGLHNAAILEAYTVYGAGKYGEERLGYRNFILTAHFRFCLAITGLLAVAATLLFRSGDHTNATTVAGLAFAITFLLSATFFRRTYYLNWESLRVATMAVLMFVAVCVGLALLRTFDCLNGFSVFLTLGSAALLAGTFFFRHYPYRRHPAFLTAIPNYWREHWGYAKWVMATAVVFQFTNQGYLWLVGAFLSVEEVGELRAAQNITLPMLLAFSSASHVVMPIMAKRFNQDGMAGVIPFFWRTLALMTGLGLGSTLLLWAAGKPIMDLVYSGKYTDAAGLLYVLGLVAVALAIGNVLNDALKASLNPKAVFKGYIAGSVTTLLLGVPLVLKGGLMGAAWGMLVSAIAYGTTLAMSFYFVSRPTRC